MDNIKDITGINAINIMQGMIHFKNVHNELRKDFLVVYNLATDESNQSSTPKPLIRSCIKELFSLIEADIYLYNQYNPYRGFDDKDSILDKFKKTFKHHGKEFNKSELVAEFNSKQFESIRKVKVLRDAITHPKSKLSIQVTREDLALTFEVYNSYTDYVNMLMTGTALRIEL